MKILITIETNEKDLKEAIAKGWNEAYGEELTSSDIVGINNPDDIIRAFPYISDLSKIEVK